jgi:transcriptional regulator with XRE-family HTH domain
MANQKINLPSVGQVVKAWRVVRGLSGTELSARAGLPKAYISQVEHGRVHQPGDENLKLIAGGLQIPVEYLVTRRLPDKETQTAGKPTQLAPTPGTPILRQRLRGALGSSPIEKQRPGSESEEATTLGQRIDAILEEEGLSIEDRERIATFLIPHTKELARFIKLVSGERNDAEK